MKGQRSTPPTDTIIFDLDGTLVDSSSDITRAVNGMLRERGMGEVTPKDVIPLLGEGAPALVHGVFAIKGRRSDPLGVIEDCTRRYLQLYAEDPVRDSQLYHGARATLDALYERGIKLGVCTNKNEALAKEVLRQLDVLEHFDSVVGGDRLGVCKPHPDHLLSSLEELGGQPHTCIFVGDSAIDVACAERAGIRYYVVAWAPPSLSGPRLGGFTELLALTSSPSAST